MFSEDWRRYANQVDEPGLLTIRTNGLLESFTSLLRGHVERPEAFARNGRIIHLQNGMLHLDHESAELQAFSPDYFREMSARSRGNRMRNAPDSKVSF